MLLTCWPGGLRGGLPHDQLIPQILSLDTAKHMTLATQITELQSPFLFQIKTDKMFTVGHRAIGEWLAETAQPVSVIHGCTAVPDWPEPDLTYVTAGNLTQGYNTCTHACRHDADAIYSLFASFGTWQSSLWALDLHGCPLAHHQAQHATPGEHS